MLPTSGNGPKKILTPTEKAVSWFIVLALLAGGVYLFSLILPWLITLLVNSLYFAGLLALIGGTTWFIISNRKMIALRYQLWVKKMWRSIVKSDPISVMEIQWKKWSQKRQELNESIKTMEAGEYELLMAMDKKQSIAKDKFAQAKQAKKLEETRNDPTMGRKATKNSIIANRLMKSNQDLVPRLKAIQTAIGYCKDLYDHWGDDLELLKQDIDMKKDDLKLYASTSNAFDSAKSVLNDNPDERALWEMANEAYAERISNYVANITRFTEQAKDWVYDKDVQSAVWEDEGLKLLDMYDKETFNQLTDFRSLLNKDENATFAEKSNSFQKVLASPMTQPHSSTFKDLS